MTLRETQSGINRHLETKVCYIKKTDHSRTLLHRENMTLPYGINGVTNPLENYSCFMILPHCSILRISYHNGHPPNLIFGQ